MNLKRSFRAVAISASALVVIATAATSAAAQSTPSKSAQKAFTTAIDKNEITQIPDAEIAKLGLAICSLLGNGKSVGFVNSTLTTPTSSTSDNSFPQDFVTLMLVKSAKYLCPSEVAKVNKYTSSHKAPKLVVNQTLAGLLPPESDNCSSSKTVSSPSGLVGLVDEENCSLPNLGKDSYVYGYIFDNAKDYQASLATYNAFKQIVPTTPGVGCPTSNDSDNGSVGWSNSAFPSRPDQVIECTMEATSSSATTNNIPDYVWTVPSKYVILSAFAAPGTSMQTLDTWWTNYANT